MTRVTTLSLVVGLICLVACTPVAVQSSEPRDLTPSATWSGDYPIAALDQLPPGQQQNRAGYIGDVDTFARVWQSFMPAAALPAVDFANNLVVFHRNVVYYNRTNIFKVTLDRRRRGGPRHGDHVGHAGRRPGGDGDGGDPTGRCQGNQAG